MGLWFDHIEKVSMQVHKTHNNSLEKFNQTDILNKDMNINDIMIDAPTPDQNKQIPNHHPQGKPSKTNNLSLRKHRQR